MFVKRNIGCNFLVSLFLYNCNFSIGLNVSMIIPGIVEFLGFAENQNMQGSNKKGGAS